MIKVCVGNNMGRQSVIIDENTTIRQALEDNGIDYSVGMTSLDGATMKPGDMDKTFADFGITEKCYLLNVVKADNAAGITVIGNACVVTSGTKLEDLKKIKKYRTKALTLYEGEGKEKEPVFAVGIGTGMGSINKNGVSFSGQATNDGYACVTLIIPDGTESPSKWVEETVGTAILQLNRVEAQFAPAIAEIDEELDAIRANITVM